MTVQEQQSLIEALRLIKQDIAAVKFTVANLPQTSILAGNSSTSDAPDYATAYQLYKEA